MISTANTLRKDSSSTLKTCLLTSQFFAVQQVTLKKTDQITALIMSFPCGSSSGGDHRRTNHPPEAPSTPSQPEEAPFRFNFSDDEDIDLDQRPPLIAQTDLMTATESITSGIETRNDLTTPLVPKASDLNEPGILNAGNLHQLGKGLL